MLLNFVKDLKLLRIYSRGIERKDFPGPAAYKHIFEDVVSRTKPKWSLREISLHQLIRRIDTRYACKLKQLEDKFNKLAKLEQIPSASERFEYYDLVLRAEAEYFKSNAFDIVLCTCNEVAGERFRRYFCPSQCIIDEAARCTEPDTMAPISLSEHVVLLGDHKQLGPIVMSKKVEDILKISLFEHYSKLLRKTKEQEDIFFQLKTQFRMVCYKL